MVLPTLVGSGRPQQEKEGESLIGGERGSDGVSGQVDRQEREREIAEGTESSKTARGGYTNREYWERVESGRTAAVYTLQRPAPTEQWYVLYKHMRRNYFNR